jgi:hypothetical protein
MTHNPIRSQWSRDALELAARPQGTNTYECAKLLGGSNAHASERLKTLARHKTLHCVEGDRAINRLNQYFTDGEHAVAWKDATHKKNAAYRDRSDAAKKNHKRGRGIKTPLRVQRSTWNKLPMEGMTAVIPKDVKRTGGHDYPGCDTRYALTDEKAEQHKGPWGTLPIGRYPE